MIVVIYPEGSGVIAAEEFREATSVSAAVSAYAAEYDPPRVGYTGLECLGWTEREDPGQGMTWSVDTEATPPALLATPLAADLEFVASSSLSDAAIIGPSWQDLDGLVTALGGLTTRWADAEGRVVGQIATNGAGVELRVVRGSSAAPVPMHPDPHAPPDTAGAWVTFAFSTTAPAVATLETYRLQGRLTGAAVSGAIRWTNISLSVPRG